MELLTAIIASFVLGLGSSSHCLVMCGPIQAVWTSAKRPGLYALYQFARTGMYVLIGLLFHEFQGLLSLPEWVSNTTALIGLSLVMGVLLYVLVEFLLPESISKPLVRWSSRAGKFPIVPRTALFGAINGLLPCGMVWMAAGVAAPYNRLEVVVLMAAFALGTQPVLLGVGVIKSVTLKLQNLLVRRGAFGKLSVPFLVLVLGIVLTYRGYHYQKELSVQGNANNPTQICVPPAGSH